MGARGGVDRKRGRRPDLRLAIYLGGPHSKFALFIRLCAGHQPGETFAAVRPAVHRSRASIASYPWKVLQVLNFAFWRICQGAKRAPNDCQTGEMLVLHASRIIVSDFRSIRRPLLVVVMMARAAKQMQAGSGTVRSWKSNFSSMVFRQMTTLLCCRLLVFLF